MSQPTVTARVSRVINDLPREFRPPVLNALRNSDGTMDSFQAELSSQVWDHPDLPVQDILDQLTATV